MVPGIRSDRQTDLSQYSASPTEGGVKSVAVLYDRMTATFFRNILNTKSNTQVFAICFIISLTACIIKPNLAVIISHNVYKE